MMPIRKALALVTACIALSAADASADTVVTQTVRLEGESVQLDVYRPDQAMRGIAIIAHGFARDRSRHRRLGHALADVGIVAVVPDLPHVADHWSNGDALAELVRDVEGGAIDVPLLPRSHIVLIGTSAGGLASVIAASKLPGLGGWIGLDPVDRTGSGARAAARMTAPAIVMLGEPSACNLYGSGRSFAAAATALVRTELFPGASHCDFEAPTTNFCRNVCGRTTPGMDDVTRMATVTAALDLLAAGDTASPRAANDHGRNY
jgi:dienelactone hydrolase